MGKKQEMSQVYNNPKNEFIFGENGGKGKHLTSFLKNLSLTGSSSSSSNTKKQGAGDFHDVNSNIYGSLAYNANSKQQPHSSTSSLISNSLRRTPTQRSASMGTSFPRSTPPPDHNPDKPVQRRSHSNTRYADLDDDWDAGFDDVAVAKRNAAAATTKAAAAPHFTPEQSPMVDLLYPDLAIPVSSSTTSSPRQPAASKDSLDIEDYRAKLEINKLNQLNTKYAKFRKILAADTSVNIQDLRKLSWNGIPVELRALSWQILLGYLPTNKSRQSSTLARKRQEYSEGLETVEINFGDDKPTNNSVTAVNNNREKQLYHQIKIDVKRTNPTIKLYAYPETQQSLRKVLYLWAVRHPASGYVQGINDLATPFYQIFLGNYIWQLQKTKLVEASEDSQLFIPGLMDDTDEQEQQLLDDPYLLSYNVDNFDPSKLSDRVHTLIEADTYWCLSRLLENITDNYIHEQPGIIRQVNDLRNLIARIDVELLAHFDQEGIEFIQFAFRWMNCLLMRELSIPLVIRMWDTYLSETPLGFNNFHIYVCAAFLVKFSAELKEKDFQEILLFLQNPPTTTWTEKDLELMLSEAFIWQSLYKNASAHLR